jgi:Type I phosphodiesterase / nucleotide pyrophosphatase
MFGVSLSAVAKAQATWGMGYVDATGTPSAGLVKDLDGVDGDLRRMMEALKAKGFYQSTRILIAGGYGLAPMDSRQRRVVALTAVAKASGLVTHNNGGAGAMIWPKDSAKTQVVAKALSDQAERRVHAKEGSTTLAQISSI